MTVEHLQELLLALESDDPRICQGHTVLAEGIPGNATTEHFTREPRACCPIGFCGWGEGSTVGDVMDWFEHFTSDANDLIYKADEAHDKEDGGVLFETDDFLTWFDNEKRAVAFKELAEEIRHNLKERHVLSNV